MTNTPPTLEMFPETLPPRKERQPASPEGKPLFIALNAEHFDAFAAGNKTHEYRLAGGRFNERTCWIGREVILSRGYGKKNRLKGRIEGFEITSSPCERPEWQAIYGDQRPAASIYILLETV